MKSGGIGSGKTSNAHCEQACEASPDIDTEYRLLLGGRKTSALDLYDRSTQMKHRCADGHLEMRQRRDQGCQAVLQADAIILISNEVFERD